MISSPTRMYVKNRQTNGPHFIDIEFEEVVVKGTSLLHPHLHWDAKAGGATPFTVYPDEARALQGALELARQQWVDQFGWEPTFVTAAEYLKT